MQKPKIQKENGLVLTLKELIDLGIIKIKRKRKRSKKLNKRKKIENATTDNVVRSSSDHMKGFSAFGNATTLNPNSDVRQLSIANDANNSRFTELKNQLATEREKNDLFIENTKGAFGYVLNNMTQKDRFANTLPYTPTPRVGFVPDDSIDITETKGDDTFEPQIDYQPGGTIPPPQLTLSLKQPEEPTITPEREFTPQPSIETTLKKQSLITSMFGLKKKAKSKTPESKTPDENPKTGGGGVETPDFSPRIIASKYKATKQEIDQWKEWYNDLNGDDETIINSTKRSVVVGGVIDLLQTKYKNAGGNDKSILKSKDPNVIDKAILKVIQNKF